MGVAVTADVAGEGLVEEAVELIVGGVDSADERHAVTLSKGIRVAMEGP